MLQHSLAKGEPKAVALNLFPVQAAKDSEDTLVVIGMDTPPIVRHAEDCFLSSLHRGHADPRGPIRAAILDSVPDQILEHLGQTAAVHPDGWQLRDLDERAGRPNSCGGNSPL